MTLQEIYNAIADWQKRGLSAAEVAELIAEYNRLLGRSPEAGL